MQANNNSQMAAAPGSGQVNMSQLVRAQHVQALTVISPAQKAQWISAISNFQTVVQNQPPGSDQYNNALRHWQNATLKWHEARKKMQAVQHGNPQAGAAQGSGQQNVAMQQQQQQQQQQGNQGGQQMPQQRQAPAMPAQVMNYVNNYTYYHPSGVGPGHPDYEKYRDDVKMKHAKILYDCEKNKNEAKKIKARLDQLQSAGQEVPAQVLENQRRLESQTAEMQATLVKWQELQLQYKRKYEQMKASGALLPQLPFNGEAAGSVDTNAQSTQAPNASNPSNPALSNPSNDSAANQAAAQSGPQPSQAPAGQQPPQRPSINAQQPPMPNMQQTPQSSSQSGQPTPLTHQQAVQRAYSDQRTPQSATPANGQTAAQPAQQQHSQPYASGPGTSRDTTTSSATPGMKMMSRHLSPSLSQPPVPVQNYPQARPTLAGPANGMGGVMGQPAVVKQTFNMESTESGGVLSKKKLDELVRQVTGGGEGMGGETLTAEVEEAMLMMADEFVDNVVTAACKLAKLRDSNTLDVRDIQLILERNYNIRVPGYASDELRAIRKFAPAPGWTAKMNAIQAAKVMGGQKDI